MYGAILGDIVGSPYQSMTPKTQLFSHTMTSTRYMWLWTLRSI